MNVIAGWRQFRRLGLFRQVEAVVIGLSIGFNTSSALTIGDPAHSTISAFGNIALAAQFGFVILAGRRLFGGVVAAERRLMEQDIKNLEDEWEQMARRLRVLSGQEYLVKPDGTAILCLSCGKVSHNRNDVSNKFCGNCHKFLDVAQVN